MCLDREVPPCLDEQRPQRNSFCQTQSVVPRKSADTKYVVPCCQPLDCNFCSGLDDEQQLSQAPSPSSYETDLSHQSKHIKCPQCRHDPKEWYAEADASNPCWGLGKVSKIAGKLSGGQAKQISATCLTEYLVVCSPSQCHATLALFLVEIFWPHLWCWTMVNRTLANLSNCP